MIVIDASVWVSLLAPEDVNHVSTRDWSRRSFPAGEVPLVPGLVFAEVAGALARRIGNADAGYRAVAHIKRLQRLRVAELDTSLWDDAALLAAELGLRGADATYVAVAQRFGVPLVTWDQEQAARASAAVPVQAPDGP